MVRKSFWAFCLIATMVITGCSNKPEPEKSGAAPAPQPTGPSAAEQFADLGSNFDAKQKELMAELTKVLRPRTKADRELNRDLQTQLRELVASTSEKVSAIADQAEESELAAKALTWVAMVNSKNRRGAEAFNKIKADHLDSPFIGNALTQNTSPETLSAIVENSSHDDVKAIAQTFITLKMKDDDEREESLVSLDENSASIVYRDTTVGDLIRGPLNTLRHLRVGKPAMDIVGPDTDGTEFKLSDYRGKVVLLDFWGDW